MTAAGPTCSPASSQSSQSAPVCLPACHLKRGKALQTKLHLRSAPGVWLLLGVAVVLVGMGVAVAGYVSAVPKPAMKVGPAVMGVGLFIFICAATLLYENRDLEVLRRGTSDDLEDLKGGDGWEDSQEQPGFSCQEQWECRDGQHGSWAAPTHTLPLSNQTCDPPLPPPHRNTHNISSRPTPPPPRDAGDREEEEEEEGRSTLLARVLHHQEPTPCPPSPCPSNVNIRTGFPQQ